MKRLALAALVFLSTAAPAQSAIKLVPNSKVEFTDCSGSGSSAQNVPVGKYLMRVTDADVFICIADAAAVCSSGGEKFPIGTVISITVAGNSGNKSIACRSAGTGDVIFTKWE